MNILPRLWSDKEILYQRKQFQEILSVHGIGVKYYPVVRDDTEKVLDFYNDVRDSTLSYKDPLDIRIVFETVPSIRTLKSLGWFIKDEQLPYIAYIPTIYINESNTNISIEPNVDDKILLIDNTTNYTDSRSKRYYAIKDMRGQGYPNIIYYIGKLVPIYEKQESPEMLGD